MEGSAAGFYGPRDIAVGSDNSVYVIDQGNGRVVRFDRTGNLLAVWGSTGKGDGQFMEPTGLAVDGINNRVYVADPRNRRIQVFDRTATSSPNGWSGNAAVTSGWIFQHLVFDQRRARLYASSLGTDEVLVFDLQGKKIGSLKPKSPDKLEGASAMALVGEKLYVLCTVHESC